ncbi:serine/threonine protein kinase [Nonomuraea endophytica]|uniref:serine/threonine protein kinase n=1 Tax=Nonomuraea endophytica TaxID=714136 RepID=UPI0037C65A17
MHPIRPDDPKKLGGYVLLERLPEGPRGAAFLGQESEDAPIRVIKLLTGQPGAEDVARFAGARRVSGSAVARTVDTGLHEGSVYVVREHVEGRSLAEMVAADGPLGADAVERVASGILTALIATHLAGLTHRGLTPANVIMGADGVRVTDPDLGEATGEVGYRSPEQRRGEPYGSAADLFAWAATVVFAATGKAPSEHEADPNGVPALGSLAEPLREVVAAALSKEADQRPSAHTALLRLLGSPPAEPELTADLPLAQLDGRADLPPGQPDVTDKLPLARPDVMAELPTPENPAQPPVSGPSAPPPMAGVAPLEGVPVPQQPPPQQHWGPPQHAWEPPRPQQPRALQASVVGAPGPRRKFPVGLVASVAALMVLSGAGLWGASRYTDTQRINAVGVAADGKVTDGSGGSAVTGENGVSSPGDGTVPQQGEPGADSTQPEVPVPWATSPAADPDAVGPLILPTEEPSGVPTAPAYSSVPTPSRLPAQPVPTSQPTTAQPTTAQPTTARPTTAQPATPQPTTARPTTARPTTPQPKPTQSKSPQPVTTQSKSPPATETATAEPTYKNTKTPEPTPSPAKSSVTPSPAPAPSKTTTAPAPTTNPPAPAPVQQPVQQPAQSSAPPPAPPQQEPKNPYTPVQVCGSGFYVQRSQAFNGGETFQLYNTGTKQNCVVTMKYAGVGKDSPVSATLDVQGGGTASDGGNFKYYAGPVKLLAPGKCVKFSGSVGAASTAAGWANCG